MKVLIISTEIPYPPTFGGARLKLFELLKYLSARHELTLFTLIDTPQEQEYVTALEPYCRSVRTFPKPDRKPVWRDYFRAGYWRMRYSPAMAAAIREEFTRSRYDLVHVDTGFAAMYVRDLPAMPRLLAAHDCLSLVFATAVAQASTFVERLKRAWWAHTMRVYERQLYRQYHGCVLVAQPDADELATLCPELPVWIVPSGVDTEHYRPEPAAEQSEQLVFTGSMEYPPNEDAVIHFVKEIFPPIRREIPAAHFSIVGRNPTDAVLALANEPGVTVTGFVEDLRPHVCGAGVYVCPLRMGAGMKNKMLEAFSMGKAIVATRAAASGLAVSDGVELQLRDEDEAFAAAVVELIRQPTERHRLGERARAYVLQHHSWEQTGRLMDEAYRETYRLARGRQPEVPALAAKLKA